MRALLLCVHGLTPAALGCYGNERHPTPHLDRFARQAVVFDQHFADVPSVCGARAALVHGRHRFPAFDDAPTPLPASTDLRVLLRERDVRSFLVTDNSADFSTGWDDVLDDVESALGALSAAESGLLVLDESLLPPWDVPDEALNELFASEDDAPELVPWLDPEACFLAPDDGGAFERLQRTFAAVVRHWDQRFGALLEMLTSHAWFDDALFLVTSGRGQALGEHALVGDHRPWLHEELVHVPLLIRLPRGEQGNRRVFHLTQTVDLPATILDAFTEARPADWHGHCLLPLCGGAGPARDYACFGLQIGDTSEFALRTADLSILLPHRVPAGDPPRRSMLFVKPDDRWEVNDLRQSNLDHAEAFEQTLRAYVAASAQPGPLVVPPLPRPEES